MFLVGHVGTQKQDSTTERVGIKWDLLDSRQRSATWQAVGRSKQIQKVHREERTKTVWQRISVGGQVYVLDADYGEWGAGVLAGKDQVTEDRQGMTWQHRFEKLNSDGCYRMFLTAKKEVKLNSLFVQGVLLKIVFYYYFFSVVVMWCVCVCMFWYFNELTNGPKTNNKVVLYPNL